MMQAMLPPNSESENVYRSLLESTKAIPWKIDWDSQRYAYVGPQIETLLGWRVADWGTVQDWADRIHPEDRDPVVNRCIELSLAGIDHEADYRAETVDGRYIWVRETVHVLRNEDGSTQALVGFLFDISERKAAEEKILQLQKELQHLSYQDGLTKVANRRRFDEALQACWEQAQHAPATMPIALIMLDVDYFKRLNDHYGHVYGDQCLVRVADLLHTACDKPEDLVARYGGEEFVVLLPGVSLAVAQRVAERFQNLLAQQRIPHIRSPFSPCLTASIGIACVTPTADTGPGDFLHAVDHLLYQAKNQGRNRIVAQEVELPLVTTEA